MTTNDPGNRRFSRERAPRVLGGPTADGMFSVAMTATHMDLTVHRGTVALSTKQGTPVVTLTEGQHYRLIAEPPERREQIATLVKTRGRTKGE